MNTPAIRGLGAGRALPVLGALMVLAACQTGGAGSPSAATSPSSAASTSAAEDATVTVVESPEVGEHLVDAEGRTVYIFLNDMAGHSMCTDDCAEAWPPVTLEEGEAAVAGEGVTAELATIERAEGTLQLTLDGQPLYLYAEDQEPGDVNGEGVGGVWFVARPDGSLPEASASAGASAEGTEEESPDESAEETDEGSYYTR